MDFGPRAKILFGRCADVPSNDREVYLGSFRNHDIICSSGWAWVCHQAVVGRKKDLSECRAATNHYELAQLLKLANGERPFVPFLSGLRDFDRGSAVAPSDN